MLTAIYRYNWQTREWQIVRAKIPNTSFNRAVALHILKIDRLKRIV